MNQKVAVLIYDGYCNLCGAIIRLVKRHDRKGRFEFVPAQSEIGGQLLDRAGLKQTGTETVVLVYQEEYYLRSTAALKIFRLLGGCWATLYIFIVVPRVIRDFVYDIIAKTRYRLFGRSASCYIP